MDVLQNLRQLRGFMQVQIPPIPLVPTLGEQLKHSLSADSFVGSADKLLERMGDFILSDDWVRKYRQKISDPQFSDEKLRRDIKSKRLQVAASLGGVGSGMALVHVTFGLSAIGAGLASANLVLNRYKLQLLEAEWARRVMHP